MMTAIEDQRKSVWRCRVCERRAMSDQVAGLRDDDVLMRQSHSGVLHLTDRSGYTFCGKDGDAWPVVEPDDD